MKFRKPWLSSLAAAALLTVGPSIAQDTPPSASSAQPPAAPAGSAVYQTPQGELTVRSQPAVTTPPGPPPSFAQLAGKGRSISEEQAAAYPLLANDFQYADSNRDGHISKAEFDRWLKQQP
jgi:hypothetical protein